MSQIVISDISADLRERFETEAQRLNLTLAAYLRYLMERQHPDADSDRLDRHVGEVFGRYGKAMRKLAE